MIAAITDLIMTIGVVVFILIVTNAAMAILRCWSCNGR